MLMLDLCAGLKTASAAMLDRGWTVITVGNNPDLNPDMVADIREWSYNGTTPDLIWASPPCDEFSREFMVWSRTGKTPDMSIVNAAKRIIQEVRPRFWIIENTRGAVPFLGKPSVIYYPYYLWGSFPPLGQLRFSRRHKESYSSKQKAERARIPYELSKAVACAIEFSRPLFAL